MDKDEVKLKHKVQIRRKKPEKKGFASVIVFFKRNTISCIICGLVVAGAAATIVFWPKGEVTPPTPPTVVDSLENVVDSSAVVRSDTLTTITEEPTANVDNPAETEAKPVNEEQKNPETEIVNNPPVTQSGDITMDAKKAIRGDFGNGAERRKNLGANYDKVQAVVNKMYQDGNLHW